MALIRALSNAGDHAAALKYAERYQEIVSQELGTSVGPEVAKLVAEVRERAKTASVVVRGSPAPVAAPPRVAELQTENLEPRSDSPLQPEVPLRRRSRAPYYMITAFSVVMLGALLMSLRGRASEHVPPAANVSSLAVLPLVNVSGNAQDVPIVDGLTEELIGVLSKIDGLRVTARTSAFVFRNSSLDVRKIADSLGVRYIIEGGVQKIGDRMRVQMRLVDASDASTRWSEIYERGTADIFLVQTEIAEAVARELDLRLSTKSAETLRRKATENVAAHELYLRGSDPALLRSDSTAAQALDYFAQAIELDSSYAAPYAGLARMHLRLNGTRYSPGRTREEAVALARAAAMKALALDDSLAEAHASFGLTLRFKPDVAAAVEEFKIAVSLDPNYSRVHEWLSFMYTWQMRPADALAEARLAVEKDPLSPSAHAEFARTLCSNGQIEEGLEVLKRVASVKPPLARATLFRFICYGMRKDWPSAIAMVGDQSLIEYLGFALGRNGDREKALVILNQLTRRARSGGSAFDVAIVHAGLGNMDETFDWLNRAVDDMSVFARGFIILPLLDDVRADPRFEILRKRLGL
jgi:TolB-like protein